MYTKSDEQFIIIQDTIESNKQEAAEKQMKNDEEITQLAETLNNLTALMMDQTSNSKSSPTHKDTSTPPYPTTVVLANKRGTSSEGGHTLPELVACVPSNMISAHQNYMSSSSIQNSK